MYGGNGLVMGALDDAAIEAAALAAVTARGFLTGEAEDSQ